MQQEVSKEKFETSNLIISIVETQEVLKLGNIHRSKITVEDFQIQKVSGNYERNETTLWIPGKGWLTMKQIIKEVE